MNENTITPEQVSASYTMWLRLDTAGFKLMVRNGRLHLYDTFETLHGAMRTATDLMHDAETARTIYQLAEADQVALAVYVEQMDGKLPRVEFDLADGI